MSSMEEEKWHSSGNIQTCDGVFIFNILIKIHSKNITGCIPICTQIITDGNQWIFIHIWIRRISFCILWIIWQTLQIYDQKEQPMFLTTLASWVYMYSSCIEQACSLWQYAIWSLTQLPFAGVDNKCKVKPNTRPDTKWMY